MVSTISILGLTGCSDSKNEERIRELNKSLTECADMRLQQDEKIRQLEDKIVKLEKEKQSLANEVLKLKGTDNAIEASTTLGSSKVQENRKWTGATSINELENKIKGTWWNYVGDSYGIAYKFHFDSNGKVTIYKGSSRNGEWLSEKTFPYKVKQMRMNNGNAFASVQIQDDEKEMKYSGFALNFTNHGMRVILTQFGSEIGQLRYGNYQFKDGI